MTPRLTLRFSLLGCLIFVGLCAMGVRLWAPVWEFQRLLDGDETSRLLEIRFIGRNRNVVLNDPAVLAYFEEGIRGSDQRGRIYYPSGVPEGPARIYRPYRLQLTLKSGTYEIPCSVSENDLCFHVTFEKDLSGEGAPNRRMVIDGAAPERIHLMVGCLLAEDDL